MNLSDLLRRLTGFGSGSQGSPKPRRQPKNKPLSLQAMFGRSVGHAGRMFAATQQNTIPGILLSKSEQAKQARSILGASIFPAPTLAIQSFAWARGTKPPESPNGRPLVGSSQHSTPNGGGILGSLFGFGRMSQRDEERAREDERLGRNPGRIRRFGRFLWDQFQDGDLKRGGESAWNAGKSGLGAIGSLFRGRNGEAARYFGEFVRHLQEANRSFDRWTKNLNEENRRFAIYSGQIAYGTSVLDAGRLRREIDFARNTGNSARAAMEARNRYEDAVQPSVELWRSIENRIAQGIDTIRAEFVEIMVAIGKLVDVGGGIGDWLEGEGADPGHPQKQLLDELRKKAAIDRRDAMRPKPRGRRGPA